MAAIPEANRARRVARHDREVGEEEHRPHERRLPRLPLELDPRDERARRERPHRHRPVRRAARRVGARRVEREREDARALRRQPRAQTERRALAAAARVVQRRAAVLAADGERRRAAVQRERPRGAAVRVVRRGGRQPAEVPLGDEPVQTAREEAAPRVHRRRLAPREAAHRRVDDAGDAQLAVPAAGASASRPHLDVAVRAQDGEPLTARLELEPLDRVRDRVDEAAAVHGELRGHLRVGYDDDERAEAAPLYARQAWWPPAAAQQREPLERGAAAWPYAASSGRARGHSPSSASAERW